MADEPETHAEADEHVRCESVPCPFCDLWLARNTGAPRGRPLMERDPEPESPWWP